MLKSELILYSYYNGGEEEFIFKGLVTKNRKENPKSTMHHYIARDIL